MQSKACAKYYLTLAFTTTNESYMQVTCKTCVLFLLPEQRTVLKSSAVQGLTGRIYKYTIYFAIVYFKKGCKFTEN